MEYRYVGENIKRVDAIEKVNGNAVFVADIKLPGMLYAKVLRSTKGHAIIKDIDISEAESFAGVVKIITGKEFSSLFGACISDQTPLAVDKVRYVGEPVAVVIADTEFIARKALKKIKVEYEDQKVLLDPFEAARDSKNLIHPKSNTYHRIDSINPINDSNIFHHFKINKGDIEKAFKEADLVIEKDYYFPSIHHVQLEPHGAVAYYRTNGTMSMWSSTQAPYVVRNAISELLGIPQRKIRVKVSYVGGGFGGKSDVTIEPLAACLARAVPNRPIRLILTREEMVEGTVIGRGIYSKYRTAINRDGKILGEKIEIYVRGGGYGEYAVNIVNGAGISATGPYEIPNIKVDCYGVYTNTPPTGACRGYGHPEVHWACERQRDIIAQNLEMSPIEFRLKNILKPGKKNSIGQTMQKHNGRLDLCVEKVLNELNKSIRYDNETKDIVTSKGVAVFMKCPVMPTNAQSGAILKLNEDGGITLSVGAIEMGQGCNTVLAQIAAEALKITIDKVEVVPEVDTFTSPYEWQTVASHTTWAVGNAVLLAAEDMISKLMKAASGILNEAKENLYINNGRVLSKTNEKSFITFEEISQGYKDSSGQALNVPIIGVGNFVPKGLTYLDPKTGQGNIAADWTMGCQGVEIEVNSKTGDMSILNMVTAIDAGKIINPQLAEGQIFGAAIQAMGAVLHEELIFSKDGVIRNKSLTDYKTPGIEDIPKEHNTIFIETPEEGGPFGARGLGEHGTVGIAPAIASALYNGLKINLRTLPLNKEKVLTAIRERREMNDITGV